MKFHQAAETLLNRPWESDTMPEMALLAFLSIEAGDLFLSNGLVEEARRAYRLAPSKTTLVEKQKQKLNELTHTFKARRANVGMGGIMWTDFYEQLIGAATAQLAALEDSEDYTDPLQLRRGKSALLAKRTYEAWLIFERLSQSVSLEVAEDPNKLKQLEELQAALEACDGWNLENEVRQSLALMGFRDLNRSIAGLSGGEQKKIALARLFMQKPDFMLLDEPTSAMDPRSERLFVARMKEYTDGKTLVVVTHRKPILALVSRVLVVERGQIVMDGTRDEVLKKISS